MRRKKNAFTLIELIAVLVILAILALIVTPLVMNIIKKAKDSANKRSVDAYGKAVELAIATHLLDTGDYPTSLDNLTVEYTGNEVVCNIKTLNEDGSIYLSECSVKGTEVKDSSTEDGFYHYGKTSSITHQTYKIGDMVTYNGMNFYVIANSDEASDRVTLLKAEPLKTVEMSSLIESTEISNFVSSNGDYLTVPYFTKDTCQSAGDTSGCITDYNLSVVKQIVDVWGLSKLEDKDLTEDYLGYKTRLITRDELFDNLGYALENVCTVDCYQNTVLDNVPTWVYNNSYSYWTMSQLEDSYSSVWVVDRTLHGDGIMINGIVRPVITLSKTAIK